MAECTSLSFNNLLINYYNNKQTKCEFNYPFKEMLSMMTNNNKSDISQRSIMIEINGNGNTFFKRNFEKNDKTIKNLLMKEAPSSIHMGKLLTNMTFHELDNNTTNINIIKQPVFITIEKEFVFDIDSSDYDIDQNKPDDTKLLCKAYGNLQQNNNIESLRVCPCKFKKTACSLCWYLMGAASIVIRYFMINLFDVKNILWVYSGNRGIHCWVREPMLMESDENIRKCVMEMMIMNSDENIFNNLTNQKDFFDKLFTSELYPYFKKMIIKNKILLKLIEPLIFIFISNYYKLIEQPLKDNWNEIDNKISLLNDNDKINELNLTKFINFEKFSKNIKWEFNKNKLPEPYIFIVFRLLYPIFDSNVTTQMDHLLKLPFSIHKSTRRLSYPINFDEIPTLPIDNQDFIKRISIENHHNKCKEEKCDIEDIMIKSKELINNWLKK